MIGGAPSNASRNSDYPNLDSYLYQDRVVLDRSEIQNVYSTLNVRNEVVKALQSTPFFGTYLTWDETNMHIGDNNLLEVGENVGFVSMTGYLDNQKIDLKWTDVKKWLFTDASTNLSQESLLNALVKTQIYRPIFFKHDNYQKFTSDESQYWCLTEKTFVDHEGKPHKLVWANGEFGVVNPVASGLGPTIDFEDGHVDQDSVEYMTQNNVLQYDVRTEPITVLDDSFVYNDIQFYATRDNLGKVKSIYFNEFQKDIENIAKSVSIRDGYFTIDLNFIDYSWNKTSLNGINNADGNKYKFYVFTETNGKVAVIKVDSTVAFDKENAEDHKYDEYRMQVVGDMFNF